MIDFKEIPDSDAWEAFCRDYLIAMGLTVEIPPGRGPDGGRDILVKEQLKGRLAKRPFTWLVSCKHFAGSGRAVGNDDEVNITDRLSHHGAEGFIGFYSTLPSAALIERLKELRARNSLYNFELYDHSRIENGFHDVGLSGVLLQHLPRSHTNLRPIHPLLGEYEPIRCEICDKDLLKESLKGKNSNIIFAHRRAEDDSSGVVESVHFVCKGRCNDKIERRIHGAGLYDMWDDVHDYCNPLIFMRRITGYIEQMRKAPGSYSKAAHESMIAFYLAVAQRTLRQPNEEDRQALMDAMMLDSMGV